MLTKARNQIRNRIYNMRLRSASRDDQYSLEPILTQILTAYGLKDPF
jgi:hypothetical protein